VRVVAALSSRRGREKAREMVELPCNSDGLRPKMGFFDGGNPHDIALLAGPPFLGKSAAALSDLVTAVVVSF